MKYLFFGLFSLATLGFSVQTSAIELTVTDDGTELVELLLGSGITPVPGSIESQGSDTAAGIFTGGLSSGLEMDQGILLRTGSTLTHWRESPETAILCFDFQSETQEVYFRFAFASNAYIDSAPSQFSDVFKLYVDGKNVALIPDTTIPASTHTINAQTHADYFIDNRPKENGSDSPHKLEYRGFSRVLYAAVDLEPFGQGDPHHFKAILTKLDGSTGDSAVFLEAGTFSALPPIVVEHVTVDEDAGAITFTVSLPKESEHSVNFSYTTRDATASAGSDYAAVSGTSAIMPGSRSAEITVAIIDDLLNEPKETFVLELSEPDNAVLTSAHGIGTITDNDDLPALAISDAAAEEITQKMTFTLNLSSPSSQEISVEYSTVDETAVADEDYTATQGTLTIPAGKDSGSIEVNITLDELRDEDDEIFFVALSNPVNAVLQNEQVTGTIQNTSGSFINRALGRPLPEPSTYMLFLLGLLGLGWLARRRH